MAGANYSVCYAITRQYEGGNDDDPRDPGGRTSRGITQKEYDIYRQAHPELPADVWKAPDNAIADIYRTSYWNKVAGDTWPVGLDLTVWDAGVNSGVGRAFQWAKAVVSDKFTNWVALANYAQSLTDKVPAIKQYNAARLSFLHALRTWSTFGGGWGKRVAGIEAKSVKMALDATNAPPVEVKKKLEKESQNADVKSKSHSGGAAAGGGGAAAGGSGVDWSHLSTANYVEIGLAAIVILGVVSFFIWWAYNHSQRAAAYKQEAAAIPGV